MVGLEKLDAQNSVSSLLSDLPYTIGGILGDPILANLPGSVGIAGPILATLPGTILENSTIQCSIDYEIAVLSKIAQNIIAKANPI